MGSAAVVGALAGGYRSRGAHAAGALAFALAMLASIGAVGKQPHFAPRHGSKGEPVCHPMTAAATPPAVTKLVTDAAARADRDEAIAALDATVTIVEQHLYGGDPNAHQLATDHVKCVAIEELRAMDKAAKQSTAAGNLRTWIAYR